MSKKLCLLAVLFFISVQSAFGGTLNFRSGVVMAAEITKNVKIANLPPLAFQLPQNLTYAVISFKLDELRDLSIFDYSIGVNGVTMPAIALYREETKRYEYFTDNISSNNVVQLVFAVDAAKIPSSGKFNVVLKSNLSDTGLVYDVTVPCIVNGSKAPTAPHAIPANGLLSFR